MKVETGVLAVHGFVNTENEAPSGLGAEQFFKGSPNPVVVCKSCPLKSFVE